MWSVTPPNKGEGLNVQDVTVLGDVCSSADFNLPSRRHQDLTPNCHGTSLVLAVMALLLGGNSALAPLSHVRDEGTGFLLWRVTGCFFLHRQAPLVSLAAVAARSCSAFEGAQTAEPSLPLTGSEAFLVKPPELVCCWSRHF